MVVRRRRWTKSGERDGDESSHGRLIGLVARRGEGVKAVAGELAGGNVATDSPNTGALGEQVAQEPAQFGVATAELLVPVQKRGEIRAVMSVLVVVDERVRLKNRFKPTLLGVLFGGELGELLEVWR